MKWISHMYTCTLLMGLPSRSSQSMELSSLQLYSRLPLALHMYFTHASRWLRRWRICLQCRRLGFNPWVGKIPWKRDWQPTPVLSHGQRSPVGYSPKSRKELDTTRWLNTFCFLSFLHLVVYIYISILISQFISPSTVTCLFSMSVSLLLLQICSSVPFF